MKSWGRHGLSSRAVARRVLKGPASLVRGENKHKKLSCLTEPEDIIKVIVVFIDVEASLFSLPFHRGQLRGPSTQHRLISQTLPPRFRAEAEWAAALLAVRTGRDSTCCSAPALCTRARGRVGEVLRPHLTPSPAFCDP